MTYQRFKEIWTTLVTNRTAEADAAAEAPTLNNGVSDETVDALVKVADGDHTEFDKIEQELASISA